MRIAHHAMTFEGGWRNQGVEPGAQRLADDLAAAGFKFVELDGDEARYGPAKTLKRILADQGIEIVAVGANVTANAWPPNTEEYRRFMDYAAELGVSTLCVCGGFIGKRRNTFASDYERFAHNLAAAQGYADQYAQVLAFHPHVGCIVETQAEVEMLLRHFPMLQLCLDTGHLVAVEQDIQRFIECHHDRIRHVHLKDFDPSTDRFTEIGAGVIDFKAVLAALARFGRAETLTIERDSPPGSGIDSARDSLSHLRSIR